jgi:hypothetical protein
MQITSADHPSVYSPSFTTQTPTRQLTQRRSDHHRRNTSVKLYVIVIINSVVTNDDAINISEVIENMNMTISVTTSTRLHRATPQ